MVILQNIYEINKNKKLGCFTTTKFSDLLIKSLIKYHYKWQKIRNAYKKLPNPYYKFKPLSTLYL